MIIILEGIERTGKSTLAKEIEKKGFVYFKDTVHEFDGKVNNFSLSSINNRIDATVNFLIQLAKNNVNVVVDRCHISHFVFNKYYRESTSYPTNFKFYDELLALVDAKLVLVERNLEHATDEFMEENYRYADRNTVEEMQKEFRYQFEKSEIRKKKTVFFQDIIDANQIEYIVDELTERNILAEEEGLDWMQDANKYDFYLASPFFTESQKERENAVKQILRSAGYTVYAPFEHSVVKSNSGNSFCAEVFQSNIEAIQNSRFVVAITDGKDMGTIWEAGYAYGINKPVIYYAETLGDNPFNIMLSESGVGIAKSREVLGEMVASKNWEYKEDVNHE